MKCADPVSTSNEQKLESPEKSAGKPGLFQKLWKKLDARMLEKAEAEKPCCCKEDPSDKKAGDKCC